MTFLTWIVANGRSISVRIDLPSGPCHGIVVIVPACGREADVSYRTVRVLGHALANMGFLSCLPDLSGHGDSSGISGWTDLAQVWTQDIEAVVTEARLRAPGLPTHLVGLRLGASIAARVKGEIETRLYWEPVNGRRFVHAQRLLANFSLTDVQADNVGFLEIPGLCLSLEQAQSLRELTHAAKPTQGRVITRHETAGREARQIYAARPEDARVPFASLEEIVRALPRSAETRIVNWVPQLKTRMTLPSGAVIEESHCTIGPNHLFAVETRPIDVSTPARAVIFTAVGTELRSGSGSIWTEAARSAADQGVRAVRADRRQIGDMLDMTAETGPPAYTSDAVQDVVNLVRDVRSSGSTQVAVAGVCAGAWLAIKAATQEPIDAVLAINSLLWNVSARTCRENVRPSYLRTRRSLHRADDDQPAHPSAASRWRRRASVIRGVLKERLPTLVRQYPLVRAIILGITTGGLGAPILWKLPQQTRLIIMLGDMESSQFALIGGNASAALQRLRQHRVEVRHAVRLEHSLLTLRSRRMAIDTVLEVASGERRPWDRTKGAHSG